MAKKIPAEIVPPWRHPLARLHQPSAAPHAQGTRRQRNRQARERAALQEASA